MEQVVALLVCRNGSLAAEGCESSPFSKGPAMLHLA